MSVENVSAGLVGVAKVPQRPAKNALISNTDNPAVQQYAQVSRFTGYLTDAPVEQTEQQSQQQYSSSSQSGGSSGSGYSSPASTGNEDAAAPLLNYNRNGSTTPVQKPTVAGQFLSVIA